MQGGQLLRLQSEIEEQVKKFNQMNAKGQQFIQARNALYEQENQNTLVLKEIEKLNEGAKVYKQAGGLLLNQTTKQAKASLSQRIGFINNQINTTSQFIRKNENQQNAQMQKIKKAKQFYIKLAQQMQGQ